MHWNQDKSVKLTQGCVALFALTLAVLDVGCWPLAKWFSSLRLMMVPGSAMTPVLLTATVLSCSLPAWICLWQLWSLLAHIAKAQVFVPENVQALRKAGWCLWAACVICLISCFYYAPFFAAFLATGFMALILRIVKNCFAQAVLMKDELDLTV